MNYSISSSKILTLFLILLQHVNCLGIQKTKAIFILTDSKQTNQKNPSNLMHFKQDLKLSGYTFFLIKVQQFTAFMKLFSTSSISKECYFIFSTTSGSPLNYSFFDLQSYQSLFKSPQ